MKRIFIIRLIFFLGLLPGLTKLFAQQYDCNFKEPLINIDFGTEENLANLELLPLPGYRRAHSICPSDGSYSLTSQTSNCFRGDWLTFNEDHTPNDVNGKMMLVNANERGGIFFKTILNGFKGNTIYQLELWMINVCRINGGCAPLPPEITIKLFTSSGDAVANFDAGFVLQNEHPQWKRSLGIFTTPAIASSLILIMEDNTLGGCGNDFALDDIVIRECIKPTPVVNKPETIAPVEVKQTPPVNPVIKKPVVKAQPIKKDVPVKIPGDTSNRKPVIIPKATSEKPAVLPLPKPLLTRANPIIKQIEAEQGEITVELYDNGEIDGDTVSIYHNNELIASHKGLSEKPIQLKIKVDAEHPHHELVMVAENLGSIPPNTSLMVITANGRRSEVFISSSEQKNAKVVIDLKK